MNGYWSGVPWLLPFVLLFLAWGVFWIVLRLRRRSAPPGPAVSAFSLFDPRWLPSGFAAIAFMLAQAWSSGLVRRGEVEGPLRTGIVLLPVPLLIWFVIAWARVTRGGDELERRLQLEGAGFALPAFMTFMMFSVLLDRLLGGYPYADMWAFLPLYYWAGITLARMRYTGGGGGE